MEKRRYRIKQKYFSLWGAYTIKDEEGNDLFKVVGKKNSFFMKRFSFQTVEGEEILEIKQIFSWLRYKYQIWREGDLLAHFRSHITLWRPRFDLFLPDGTQLEIQGSLWQYDYSIGKQGETWAKVSKKIWTVTDEYGVEIFGGADDILMLAVVIMIDRANHQGKN